MVATAREDGTGPIAVRYSNRRMLLGLTQREGSATMLFVPWLDDIPVGHRVRLKVTFGDCGNKNFYIRGLVQSARCAGTRVGFEVLIQGEAEERAFSHLLAFCSRQQEPAKRFPAGIACDIRLGADLAQGKIRDLSTTGAFVATSSAAPETGSKLVLSTRSGFFGMSTQQIEARVVWAGAKHGVQGMGVEFLSNTPQIMKLLGRHADFSC